MILLIDMDGVCADFTKELLRQYNHHTNEKVKLQDIKSNQIGKYVKNRWFLQKIKDSPGFIRNLEPIDDAIDAIHMLHKKHDICFVSNATNCPTSAQEKRDWLKYYFGRIWKYPPLVLTKEKFRVRGDCLLDDDPKNLKNLYPDTAGLLFHQPYNASAKGNFTRIGGWSHFIDWVENHE